MVRIICILLLTVTSITDHFQAAEQFYREGKLEEALTIATRIAKEAQESRDTTTLIKALCLQAGAAIDLGNDTEAIGCYNTCLHLSPYVNNMFKMSSSLYNIATIYYQNGEYRMALDYINKSINIDSYRESDAILGLKYRLAAEICFYLSDYDQALEYVEKGRECNRKKANNNVEARLMLIRARCKEAMSGPDKDWNAISEEYAKALDILNNPPYNYQGAVNPYLPEFLYHLGCAKDAGGLDAKPYFIEAIRSSALTYSHTMIGVDPTIEMESCEKLAAIYENENNAEEAEKYRAMSDSLSYVPYLLEMGNKLSLSQMEFIRREKEKEIERKESQTFLLTYILAALILVLSVLAVMYSHQVRQRRMIEEKNAQLVKLSLQKDKLVNMVQSNDAPLQSDLNEIVSDSVPLPEIPLSKREKEVLTLCCQGLISKEIASKLNVSVRTVESHKFNIFKKIGVNTTNELIAFAFRCGLIK